MSLFWRPWIRSRHGFFGDGMDRRVVSLAVLLTPFHASIPATIQDHTSSHGPSTPAKAFVSSMKQGPHSVLPAWRNESHVFRPTTGKRGRPVELDGNRSPCDRPVSRCAGSRTETEGVTARKPERPERKNTVPPWGGQKAISSQFHSSWPESSARAPRASQQASAEQSVFPHSSSRLPSRAKTE